jgi:hypothetical protein
MKMVTVRIPAQKTTLAIRLCSSKVLNRGLIALCGKPGECAIYRWKESGFYWTTDAICSTEYPGGKRAKPDSYGELLVTLPAHVVRKGVKTEAV